MKQFLSEVLQDLSRVPKRLNSKYFYDAAGDAIFQQIMACEEYYLTRCEMEIFQAHATDIALELKAGHDDFDLIELGAGDASKTIHLLRALINLESSFTYVPIDISSSIIRHLEGTLPTTFPGLKISGLNGEYLDMLKNAPREAGKKRVVLFLGSNIGNMEPPAALAFCKEIRASLGEGDKMMIGFDLKKRPATVLAAYNDAAGHTRSFNLNLLKRINRELSGDFVLSQFEHYPTYDPKSGACKSYLVSTVAQQVRIGGQALSFDKDEVIQMEISQKYALHEVDQMARLAGFSPGAQFIDSRNWFVDAIWNCSVS